MSENNKLPNESTKAKIALYERLLGIRHPSTRQQRMNFYLTQQDK
jgi:hypothetical protein